MQAKSLLIKIPKTDKPTTECIEKELTKQSIKPLRWAIVGVSEKYYTVSVTNLVD